LNEALEAESLSGSGSEESEDENDKVQEDSRKEQDLETENLAHSSFVRLNLKEDALSDSHHGAKLVCRALGATVLDKKASVYEYSALDTSKPWIVILHKAGHFVAAVFLKENILKSKSIHRYVVRKKQGGSQSSKDASGKRAKSAGATLRRYNEQMIEKEIRSLFLEWKQYFLQASRIFYFVPKTKRSFLFQESSVLISSDERLRRIPFGIKRPTVNEAKRTLKKLCLVSIRKYEPPPVPVSSDTAKEPDKEAVIEMSQPAKTNMLKPEPLVAPPQPVDDRLLALVKLCTLGIKDEIVAFVEKEGSEVLFLSDDNGSTILHLVAEMGETTLIRLFLDFGSSPEVTNFRGLVPYQCCKKKEARDSFRYFMGENPTLWDYSKAAVPSALSKSIEEARKEKAKAKKKRQAQRRKQAKAKQKQDAEIAAKQAAAEAAELEAMAPTCSMCGNRLKGDTGSWFHRLNFTYCSNQCVQRHRRVLSAEAALNRLKA